LAIDQRLQVMIFTFKAMKKIVGFGKSIVRIWNRAVIPVGINCHSFAPLAIARRTPPKKLRYMLERVNNL
jgi:hypothetical protein